jgi:hypothetical protein
MKDLPKFKPRHLDAVSTFISEALINRYQGPDTCLRELITYQDGHYRALFDLGYFQAGADPNTPSKSQWSSLKKKLKRHDPRLFVFKECGVVTAKDGAARGYIDFGFFAE